MRNLFEYRDGTRSYMHIMVGPYMGGYSGELSLATFDNKLYLKIFGSDKAESFLIKDKGIIKDFNRYNVLSICNKLESYVLSNLDIVKTLSKAIDPTIFVNFLVNNKFIIDNKNFYILVFESIFNH